MLPSCRNSHQATSKWTIHLWLVIEITSRVLKLFPLTQQLELDTRHNQLSNAIELTCSLLFLLVVPIIWFLHVDENTFYLSTFSTNYGCKAKIANKRFDVSYKLDMDIQWWRDKLLNIPKANFPLHSLHICCVFSFLDSWIDFGFAKPEQKIVMWGPKDCECN